MPYININEYDKTITGSNVSTNNNIVAIPINAVDGPSDRWVVVRSYDEFIQTFGNNPNPTSLFGNSWEYAANLLLRDMPVCVRRITHTLDQYGRNLELLPNVNIAETMVYANSINDLSTNDQVAGTNVVNKYKKAYFYQANSTDLQGFIIDPTTLDESRLPGPGINYLNLNAKAYGSEEFKDANKYTFFINNNYNNKTILLSANGNLNDIKDAQNTGYDELVGYDDALFISSDETSTKDITNKDGSYNIRLNAGKIIIKNNSNNDMKITSFIFEDLDDGYKYNSKIETIKANNKSLTKSEYIEFLDGDDNEVYYPRSTYDTDFLTSYFILKPNHSILINKIVKNGKIYMNLFNAVKLSGTDEDKNVANPVLPPFSIEAFKGNAGSYKRSYFEGTPSVNDPHGPWLCENVITFIPGSNDNTTESLFDIPNNRINLFKAEYLNPGSNGNFINIAIKSIGGQGIYAYIYRSNQLLERIELVSLRYTDSETGRIKLLDTDDNAWDILKILLLKFNIILPYNEYNYDTPIVTNYVKLYLNPEVLVELKKLNDSTKDAEAKENLINIIKSLLSENGTNKCSLEGGTNPSDEHVQHEVQYCYYPLEDKYRYDIKFISNGGYVDKIVYSNEYLTKLTIDRRYIEDAMINLAHNRKDCVAYLDVPYDLYVDEVPYYFDHISSSYAAAYDPWCYINLSTGGAKWMPPSFVQLYTHAKAILNGHQPYLPPAGVRRGLVPEILSTSHDLTSKYITEWQNNEAIQFINPILWINGYDYTVYGQKTLYNIVDSSNRLQSALQNLNVRLVANDVKKLIFATCLNLTFELNNLMTWNEFKSGVTPKLQTMLAEGVLSNYEVLMGKETMTVADLNSGHCVGTVRVSIVSAAIDWDINFEITPNAVTFFDQDYNY